MRILGIVIWHGGRHFPVVKKKTVHRDSYSCDCTSAAALVNLTCWNAMQYQTSFAMLSTA